MFKLPFDTLILRHWREAGRSTNSGQLVTSCIANVKVVDMEEQDYASVLKHIPNRVPKVGAAGGGTWLLFPSSPGVPSQKGLPWPLPDTVIIVDGKWSEASKMASQLKHLPRFTPLYGPHAADRLLARPHAEAQATAEAISSVVRELSPQAADCLDAEFAKFVSKAKKASGSTAKKNPIFSVGDRVRVRYLGRPERSRYEGSVGNIKKEPEVRSGYYVVDLDDELKPVLFDVWELEASNPLEELASVVKAKKNPKSTPYDFRLGDRVRCNLTGQTGTVAREPKAIETVYVHVHWDGFEGNTTIAHYNLQNIGPLEELAMVKVKKNPNLPAGTRVNVYLYGDQYEIGTVLPDSSQPRLSGWYAIEIDSGPTIIRRGSDVKALSPVEELATLRTKKNPAPGSRVKVLPGKKTGVPARLGTVKYELRPTGYGHKSDYVVVELDEDGKNHSFRTERVVAISPLEELALMAKQNPGGRRFRIGDRVQVRLQDVPLRDSFGAIAEGPDRGLYRVLLDNGLNVGLFDFSFDTVSPMEELAAIPVKKNPQPLQPGTRVRLKQKYMPAEDNGVGTVECQVFSVYFRVVWDSGRAQTWDQSALDIVSPLDELAALGGKAQKNPARWWVGQHVHYVGGRTGIITEMPTRRGRDGAYVKVQLLDGWKGPLHESLLEPFSPVEELAALGRSKTNPKHVPNKVGDRVLVRFSKKTTLIGTVIGVNSFTYNPGDFASHYATVKFDYRGLTETRPVGDIELATAIEELAYAHQKKI